MRLFQKAVLGNCLFLASMGIGSAQTARNNAVPSTDKSWLTPTDELNSALPYWLRFHGEERVRPEGVDGQAFTGGASDGYLLNRLRFDMDVLPVSWLKFDVQVQDARAIWKNPVAAPPYQDTWDLRLAYAEIGDLEKYHAAFRVGRQELVFGDERLVGISNWTNVARSFDGYRATVQDGKFRLDAFAASVVVLRDGEVGEHTPGNYIDGLYGQMQDVVPHSTIQPYFLWRRSPSQKLENGQLGNEHFGTTGVRWVGKLPLGFDYNTETAIQRGSLGTDGVAAWAAHAAIGHKIPAAALKQPRYVVEYNFASGDGNSKDGQHGTFDQLYPSGHNKLDLADQVGWKNIQHLRTGPEWKFTKKVSVSFKYSDYWLANAHDALYNSSGNVVARQANGTAGRWVGQEFDGMASYTTTKKSEIGAGFGYLLPGTFLKATTPGHSYSYPYLYYSTAF